jgi:exonuclease III
MEQDDFDVLCLQETWIAAPAAPPTIKGYTLLEQRRPTGARGGIATYIRTALKVEATTGNEYCLHTKLILPNSQRINIANVYIPPTSSLARRDITESHATAQVESILELLQPQLTTIVCGDFNARIGTKIPSCEIDHPPRTTYDSHVCPRATWFIDLCNTFRLYILNGINSPAALTCHTGRGESTVDYMLCNSLRL